MTALALIVCVISAWIVWSFHGGWVEDTLRIVVLVSGLVVVLGVVAKRP